MPTRPSARDDLGNHSDIPRSFRPETPDHNYTRTEAMIPMRDGVKLFTLIVTPRTSRKRMPIILTRTPYSAAKRASRAQSPDVAMVLPASDEALVRNGYIRVYQDIRGRFRSKGKYVMTMPTKGPFNRGEVDQATDAWDTVDWLVKHVEESNGRVGITGVSYDGFLTLMALLDPHPALKAAVPINSLVDGWIGDDFYHHGAFRAFALEYVYQQTATRDASLKIPWGYRDLYDAFLDPGSVGELGRRYGADRLPAWNRLLDHPAYDAFWQDQALDAHLASAPVKVPVLTVHSLFDQEDNYGATASHAAMTGRDRRGDRTHLAIGPWCHGQSNGDGSSLGPFRWQADTSHQFRTEMLHPFWDQHLKQATPAEPLPRVLAFRTGENRWERFDSWPPDDRVESRRLYLQADGGLSLDDPPSTGDVYTAYVSDPSRPVPYRVRPILPFSASDSTWSRWLVDDQRPFSDRPDVLCFTSAPLEEAVTVRGPVSAVLHASTTGTDADWVVKLVDVYPNELPAQPELGGYQVMVSGDILRGRYREGYDAPAPVPSKKVLPYRVEMPHVNHTFRPGHRVMVQVQSSWFPLYDRNPQTFVERIADAAPEAFVKAEHRIHHEASAASHLEVLVDRA